MEGVVSLLDQAHQDKINHLHGQIEQALGVRGLCQTPIPHFSYHVADSYDPEMLAAVLLSFAASNAGFRVRTSGLGVFTGRHTVVYLPIVRSPILTAMHHVLWRQLSRAGEGTSAFYHPDNWLPHITLVDNPALAPYLPEVMRLLAGEDFRWEIDVTNIALLYGEGKALGVRFHHPLLATSEESG
jgi:2'-5' RNA ligase